jgi:soluble lytic murein transglycosylase-like protein
MILASVFIATIVSHTVGCSKTDEKAEQQKPMHVDVLDSTKKELIVLNKYIKTINKDIDDSTANVVANAIKDASEKTGVPVSDIASIMAHENRQFDPKLVNSGGDVGLMQVNFSISKKSVKIIAEENGFKEPTKSRLKQPKYNAKIGASIYKYVSNVASSKDEALAMYNGWINGRDGYRQYVETGKENRYSRYVKSVKKFAEIYQNLKEST